MLDPRGGLHLGRASVAANTSIRVDLKEVPPVMASSGQLQQVIVNLVTNAAKSTGV